VKNINWKMRIKKWRKKFENKSCFETFETFRLRARLSATCIDTRRRVFRKFQLRLLRNLQFQQSCLRSLFIRSSVWLLEHGCTRFHVMSNSDPSTYESHNSLFIPSLSWWCLTTCKNKKSVKYLQLCDLMSHNYSERRREHLKTLE
jgi:hypothetical protein